jgi:uncharacterized repeat protein (TIGR03803 family)
MILYPTSLRNCWISLVLQLGSHPKGALLLASDGLLYGTAEEGGDHNFGTVFRLNPENADFTVIHHFNGADGRWPVAELIEENPSLTGVSFDDRKSTMGIYPNPSNGDFKIILNVSPGSFDRLVVYDVLGNEVFSRILTSTLSAKPIEVNVSHRLQAGLYTLQLSGPAGLQTQKSSSNSIRLVIK